ncbi:AMP-binding protein [Methylobrevis pamukkalensis]|uniref:Bifunctional protein Aas n=1 Tax=Methylobrevis pamukkalensis TaxID=1439726 RepID=A0A1E3H023_9HYPH|nr:AMP-binding protein [Methylobrevis pamukkalensis]ODN69525.1 Bifunctional protein Aas [Methylobrevis pamukkalensis]
MTMSGSVPAEPEGAANHRSATAAPDPAFWRRTVIDALVDVTRRDPSAICLEDQDLTPMSRGRLLLAACVLGRRLATFTKPGERVGVLLPNVIGLAVTFFALQSIGRVPAMLNFTAGSKALASACRTAGVRVVVTSSAFVKQAQLQPAVDALAKDLEIVNLEDLRRQITLADKATGFLAAKIPGFLSLLSPRRRPDDTAAVLFTSGTEGAAKGVALSHANLLANVAQVSTAYRFSRDDCMFDALPAFHSFGLTAGMLLPILGRFRCFLYPSPLHYKQIPGFIRQGRATILLTTDTFAGGWGRAADPADFVTVRFPVLGAERVKEATRKLWRDRFGLELYEGYGVTETAPVLAVNLPTAKREGTVGRLLPGVEARLEPVPGLKDAGRLFVRGPNVMMGYFPPETPGRLKPNPSEWHDTGDIVTIDAEGFVIIRGRAKRFAKIAGEMISLAAVEAHVAGRWPDSGHAVRWPCPIRARARRWCSSPRRRTSTSRNCWRWRARTALPN